MWVLVCLSIQSVCSGPDSDLLHTLALMSQGISDISVSYLRIRATLTPLRLTAYETLPLTLIDKLYDAIMCLGVVNNRLNTLRRVLLHPYLQFSYRILSDRPVAAYGLLFGDDLEA